MREFCETRLAGESLAPYKTEKFSRSSNINRAVQIGVNGKCRVETESFLLGGGGSENGGMDWCLFILEIPFWVTSLLKYTSE